jgi:AraC-like DNA-binding protein
MVDPLSEVVSLLKPSAPYSKIVSGSGEWTVHRTESGGPFFCAVMEGECVIAVEKREPIHLQRGDFVLIPAAYCFDMSGIKRCENKKYRPEDVSVLDSETRHGDPLGAADVRLLVGYCVFESPDAALLVSLLPDILHVRGETRLQSLMELVVGEARANRPAREVVLRHLLEVLVIEALRSTEGVSSSPGLVRGLSDERLAKAIRCMHEAPQYPWTVAQLAKEAALSRSTFFERFSRAIGSAPMEYLLAWRMALAKSLLGQPEHSVADVAERVGYSSANAFSVAFARQVGQPPARYARLYCSASRGSRAASGG